MKQKLLWTMEVDYITEKPDENLKVIHKDMDPKTVRSLVKKLEAQEAYFNDLKIEFKGSLRKEGP